MMMEEGRSSPAVGETSAPVIIRGEQHRARHHRRRHESLCSIGEKCVHIILEAARQGFGADDRNAQAIPNRVDQRHPSRGIPRSVAALSRLSRTCRAMYFAVRNLPSRPGRRLSLQFLREPALHLPSIAYWCDIAAIYWHVSSDQINEFTGLMQCYQREQRKQDCRHEQHDQSGEEGACRTSRATTWAWLAQLRLSFKLSLEATSWTQLLEAVRGANGLAIIGIEPIPAIQAGDTSVLRPLLDMLQTFNELHLGPAYPTVTRKCMTVLLEKLLELPPPSQAEEPTASALAPAQQLQAPPDMHHTQSNVFAQPLALSLAHMSPDLMSKWEHALRSPIFHRIQSLRLTEDVNLNKLAGLPPLRELALISCKFIKEINLHAPVHNLKVFTCEALTSVSVASVCSAGISRCQRLQTLHVGDARDVFVRWNMRLTSFVCASPLVNYMMLHANRKLVKATGPHTVTQLVLRSCPMLLDVSTIAQVESLTVEACPMLAVPPRMKFSRLRLADLRGCSVLATEAMKKVGEANATSFGKLRLIQCRELDTISSLESCNSVDLQDCPRLQSIPALQRVDGSMIVTACPELSSLPSLAHVGGTLSICRSCPALESFPKLESAGWLALVSLASMASLPSLKHVHNRFTLSTCNLLTNLSSLESAADLSFFHCEALRTVPNLEHIQNSGEIGSCKALASLPKLATAGRLKLMDLPELTDLGSVSRVSTMLSLLRLDKLEGLPSLQLTGSIHISNCPRMHHLNTVAEARDFSVEECHAFTGCASLRSASLFSAKNCSVLTDLSSLASVGTLTLSDCPQLTALSTIRGVTAVTLSACIKLQRLECLTIALDKAPTVDANEPNDCEDDSGDADVVGHQQESVVRYLSRLSLLWCMSLVEFKTFQVVDAAELRGCPLLVSALESAFHATSLAIVQCPMLAGAPSLRCVDDLRVEACDAFGSLTSLEQTRFLLINKCSRLGAIGRSNTTLYMTRGFIKNCPSLTSLPPIQFVESSDLKEATSPLPKRDARHSLAPPFMTGTESQETVQRVIAAQRSSHRGDETKRRAGTGEDAPICELELEHLPMLHEVPLLRNLAVLFIDRCGSLTTLPPLDSVVSLEVFRCNNLRAIGSLTGNALRSVSISDCSKLETLRDVSRAVVVRLSKLPALRTIGEMSSAQEVDISDLPLLEYLPLFTSLRTVSISKLPRVSLFVPAFLSKRITELSISDCPMLTPILPKKAQAPTLHLAAVNWHMPTVSWLHDLTSLRLARLETVTAVSVLRNIETVTISRCSNLERVTGLRNIAKLRLVSCPLLAIADDIVSVGEIAVVDCPRLAAVEEGPHASMTAFLKQ